MNTNGEHMINGEQMIVIDAEPAHTNSDTPTPAKPPSIKQNTRIPALEKRVAKLETDLATVAWLHAEIMHQLKMAAAAKLLANPAVQERLKQALAAQLSKPT